MNAVTASFGPETSSVFQMNSGQRGTAARSSEAEEARAVVDEEVGFAVIAVEHLIGGVAGLRLDAGAVGAARLGLGDVAGAQAVRREGALEAGDLAGPFDGAIDRLVGEAPLEFLDGIP